MNGGFVHVFAGPTISPDEVREILPGAEVHPPVRHGDLLALHAAPGDTVAVIDGVFFRTGAIRHKELLHLLQQGVTVWGASSMGALRAAELHPFGMRGVGLVYRLYSSGVVTGDDEVAVLHAEADDGHRQLSEALVNLRLGLRRARREGLLALADELAVLDALRARPFGERSVGLVRNLLAERWPGDTDRAAAAAAAVGAVNAKRADAERLLHRLAEPPSPSPGSRSSGAGPGTTPMPMTSFLLRWLRSTPAAGPEGCRVSDLAALSAIQTFSPDYPPLHRDVVLRELVRCEVGDAAATGPTGDVAARAVEAAVARGLARSRGVLPEPFAAWLGPGEEGLEPDEALLRALSRSFRWTPNVRVAEPIIDVLRTWPVWEQAREVVARADACNARLERIKPSYNPHYIADAKLRAWVLRRWGLPGPEHLPTALWDRGFGSLADLRGRAAPFVPLATVEVVDELRIAGAVSPPTPRPEPVRGGWRGQR